MLEFIRRKVRDISRQYNEISPSVRLPSSCYVSGSTLLRQVSVGDNCKIHCAFIEGNVRIGRYTSLWGPDIHVLGRIHGVEIGSFCSIARAVSIQEDFHNHRRLSTYFMERNVLNMPDAPGAVVSKGPIRVGNDVWIGAAAHILSGVTIGHGAVVGAGSVITSDVPPYAIVAGNPARVLRYRFSQSRIDELLQLAWWDWPLEKLRQNASLFTNAELEPQ